MHNHLTYDGKSTLQEGPRLIEIILTNDTESAQTRVLVSSPARVRSPQYNESLLSASKCQFQQNTYFGSLAAFQQFVEANPTQLLSIMLSPLTSNNIEEQLKNPVQIKTPTFGEDLVEVIAGQPNGVGRAQYVLHNVFLGESTDVEIILQPKNSLKLTLELGGYFTRRLIPSNS